MLTHTQSTISDRWGGCRPALSGGRHRYAERNNLLSWHRDPCAGGPLCPTAEALAAQRHSRGHPTLVVVSGRERRLKQERNHAISRQIVDTYPHSLIGLEDLTHIRERTQSGSRGKGEPEAAPSQPACVPVGVCRVAWLRGLQGVALWQHGSEGGRLQDQPGMPTLWVYLGRQPP